MVEACRVSGRRKHPAEGVGLCLALHRLSLPRLPLLPPRWSGGTTAPSSLQGEYRAGGRAHTHHTPPNSTSPLGGARVSRARKRPAGSGRARPGPPPAAACGSPSYARWNLWTQVETVSYAKWGGAAALEEERGQQVEARLEAGATRKRKQRALDTVPMRQSVMRTKLAAATAHQHVFAGAAPNPFVPTRAERESRSRETALSKTDVLILRLLLPHERFFSSLVLATVAYNPPSLGRGVTAEDHAEDHAEGGGWCGE